MEPFKMDIGRNMFFMVMFVKTKKSLFKMCTMKVFNFPKIS